MNTTFDQYCQRQNKDIPTELIAEIDSDRWRENLREDYELLLHRMSDSTFGQNYQKSCSIPGALPQDYLYRELNIDAVGHMITSIRFLGRDITKPFVEIEFIDCGWDTFFAEIEKVKEAISLSYQIFAPRSIRIFIPIAWTAAISDIAHTVDQYILSRPLRHTVSNENMRVDIERIYELSSSGYQLYRNEYEVFHSAQPALAHVKPLRHDQVTDLCINGRVYKIYSQGDWAGLCCIEESHEKFYYGYYIAGQVTFDRFKGKGIASAVQSKIISELPSEGLGFMYGTIESVNLPSIRSAQKAGREKTAAYVFIHL
jgi:RimJ/RimL family protein N-acetyltransferase